jgi:dephospho-CoA kinase
MFLVGITGGIASGKSTISAMLENLGAEIIDADVIAREVVQPGTKGLEEIVVSFGAGVLNSDGTLSREALASVVFGDEKKRLELEAILHPLIKERTIGRFAGSKSPVIVYVVPLLVEANVDYPFDLVVTIESGVETQLKRLIETRGLSKEQAQSRIMAQATEDQRVARSDIRIDGSLPLTELQGEVSKLWDSILLQASKKAGYGEN